MTKRKTNTISTDHHASWENFGKYMQNHKQNKPVIVPARIHQSMKSLAFHAKNRNVSMRAAIAFAVVVEYIVADLLENAGHVAIDNGDPDVDMKHILKAIKRDPEHSAIFVIPRIPMGKKKTKKEKE